MYEYIKPCNSKHNTDKKPEESVVVKYDKCVPAVYITIYNTNNNANEDSEAGLKQKAQEGGQISGERGQNANQGGQIAEECGQNANQDSEVCSEACGCCDDMPAPPPC